MLYRSYRKYLTKILIGLIFVILLSINTGWTFAEGMQGNGLANHSASQNVRLNLIGQAGGEVFAVAENGTYIFTAVGSRVYILDKNSIQKKAPVIIGTSKILNGSVHTITAQGNILFVAVENAGVEIIDITDPANPTRLSTYSLWEDSMKYKAQPYDIIVANNWMYLNWGNSGWEIVDIENKSSPKRVWRSTERNYCATYSGFAVKGNYLYLARNCDGQFSIMDITNKANPQFVGLIPIGLPNSPRVVVGDHYAFLIDMMKGIMVIDITQPNAPVQVGSLDQSWTFNSGAVLYGDFLYTGNWRMGLGVINVAMPANPVYVKTYQPGGYTNKIAVLDHYILMACDLFGVCVADISDPENPVYETTLYFDAPSEITNIEVRENTLFAAANYDGLRIFDVTSPSSPRQIAAYPDLSNVSSFEGFAQGLAVEGDYAYLADNHGLRVIQISDRFNPVKVGEVLFNADPGATKNLVVSGNYAYLTVNNTFEIYDIQNKAAPWKVSAYTVTAPGTYISGLAIHDDIAYIAGSTSGLRILDIHDRTHPQEIGSVSTNFWTVDVVIKNNLALICDAGRGLIILDITQPQNPKEIGHYSPFLQTSTIYSTGLAVKDQLVYLETTDGLMFLNIANPAHPSRTSSYPQLGSNELTGNQIKISGDLVYINGQYAGVYIFKQQDLPNVFVPLVVK